MRFLVLNEIQRSLGSRCSSPRGRLRRHICGAAWLNPDGVASTSTCLLFFLKGILKHKRHTVCHMSKHACCADLVMIRYATVCCVMHSSYIVLRYVPLCYDMRTICNVHAYMVWTFCYPLLRAVTFCYVVDPHS